MILNLGSLAFNANIATGGGTPSWGTELGQGDGYRFQFEGAEEFLTSMLYNSIADVENVYCPLGKGGGRREDYDFVVASLYSKIFVNGKRVKNAKFLLLIVKLINGDFHIGRRSIKYNPRMTYRDIAYNEECYKLIPQTLGISPDAAWFIDEMFSKNQDELHFTAYVVDENTGREYSSNEERKRDFQSKIMAEQEGKSTYRTKYFDIWKELPLQQIFYGAPGTGKSFCIDKDTAAYDVIRTTFHPDTDYSTFVGAYKPTMVDKKVMTTIGTKRVQVEDETGKPVVESQIEYKYVPQAFLQAYVKAWQYYQENEDAPQKQFLIIEEINRGNCAQIFGDIFQLLDRNEQGFSSYAIVPDKDIQKYISDCHLEITGITNNAGTEDISDKLNRGELLCLPNNLHIWATMNTSDQSLFPIDSAFKRRWDWQYIKIEEGTDEDGNPLNWLVEVNHTKYDWFEFVKAINKEIYDLTHSADKQLGYFFAKADENGIIDSKKLVNKVYFYLWTDVFKDYEVESNKVFKRSDSNDTISFKDFFQSSQVLDEVVAEQVLINLGLNPVSEESVNQEENSDLQEGKKVHKETLVATKVNGVEIDKGSCQFDLYFNTIKTLGADIVGPMIEQMPFRRRNYPLASTELHELQGYQFLQAGSYYFLKGTTGYTLVRVLEELQKTNQFDLKIEWR